MPKTPTGAKRPADVIGNAVHIMRIATGQTADKPSQTPGYDLVQFRPDQLRRSHVARHGREPRDAPLGRFRYCEIDRSRRSRSL